MAKNALTRRAFLADAAACSVFAAVLLAGCESSGNTDVEDDNGESGLGAEPPESQEPTVASAIIASMGNSSGDISPIGNTSALMLSATRHVLEGLYDLDLHTYKPYNALAAGAPERISDTIYEITLRDEAKFSDGSDVTSQDVVNAIAQNVADATYGPLLAFIQTAEAKDDKTITLTLNYPFDDLLERRLSLIKIFPVFQTPEELQEMPLGSGPWMYGEIDGTDGGYITFEKNDYYNGSFPATCSFMDWNIILDDTARATSLIEDNALAVENVAYTDEEQINESDATVENVPSFALPFLMFNTKKEPFNDRRVRQAFFYAIDTDKLIANEMGGHATPATSLLPETHANYHRSSNVYSFDADKASALLEEAGQSGLSLELTVNSSWVNDLAPQIQENLEAVGINVTLNETIVDWTALDDSEEVLPYDVILSPGDPSCFGNDPDLLMTWWYGDNVWTSGRTCWKGSEAWTSLQDLLQQARELPDNDERQDIWNQCLDIIAEEVPLYPLFHRDVTTAYWADKLEGFSPISTTGLMFLGVTPYK